MKTRLINANALQIPLPDESVDMCVTSPPYYGLRDYQVDGQLGLEETPEEYIENMVAVFREVWRVMKSHGTLWLNIGDSYATHASASKKHAHNFRSPEVAAKEGIGTLKKPTAKQMGMKEKDLIGIPWMLAFALRADGWYLRSDIIWSKPNPMPESVRDRPTKAHEYLFLLSKDRKYYYDADAIREDLAPSTLADKRPNGTKNRGAWAESEDPNVQGSFMAFNPQGRNKRTVWEITTKPYSGAHFATFPPDLVEPCIKAGSSEKGVCPECGNPWERVVERTTMEVRTSEKGHEKHKQGLRTSTSGTMTKPPTSETVGWQPTCEHELDPTPAIVLDPFAGSGTTLMVARQLGRDSIGIELSREYIKLAEERLALKGNWWDGAKHAESNLEGLPMFEEAE